MQFLSAGGKNSPPPFSIDDGDFPPSSTCPGFSFADFPKTFQESSFFPLSCPTGQQMCACPNFLWRIESASFPPVQLCALQLHCSSVLLPTACVPNKFKKDDDFLGTLFSSPCFWQPSFTSLAFFLSRHAFKFFVSSLVCPSHHWMDSLLHGDLSPPSSSSSS